MTLTVETEPAAIVARLDAAVAADPVGNTILATIAQDVRGGAPGWCVSDGPALAARSEPAKPVALSGGWADVAGLAAALRTVGGVTSIGGPGDAVDELVGRLGWPVIDRREERLFRCDRLAEPAGVAGTPRLATDADAELLDAWRPPYLVEVFGFLPSGFHSRTWAADLLRGSRVWLWTVAGRPVAQAAVRAPVAGVARVGPVYTPPEQRGHGYGSAVTAAATADALAGGVVPVLYTDLANPTSNKIYQRIGYTAVDDRAAVWFD